ncbi:MAG: hypothetical protein AUJ92_11200 [Armatimonadetes bacterium CG2_30_59_28]|nr:GAF domain-containing protein [Armatimonadota bacterium]OIO93957.1 MAG: hypothetical protein AUJ92_11200 [Armatimonadetes bacterium CG2_30_59_28]PIU61511.1 MAG: hypothetical protein COS85_20805 [Armatimonadetes bacterium CG07_land_8_20_14_0_80_59_28]PIX41623.1 MAG: hypothetical protein COZ56_11510 [Armatimonadetes bacterium CG_4_8_14_3_um_filter_58_9]PIY41145.1 MAG: hypothetical protein COZ05_16135 [Armatimonadetes bacterium CG_4_10_14_3_um_filter_59_10]PJB66021.1 MAG: hypothetical protein 
MSDLSSAELQKQIEDLQRETKLLRAEREELIDDKRITDILLSKSDAIASETDLDKLLTLINDEARELLEADRCTVFVLDDEKGELWSRVATGIGRSEIRIPKDMGIAGHVATTGESINIPDAYDDPRFNRDVDKATGYRTRALLCMPMRNRQQDTIGVVQVLNKKEWGGRFDDKDEKLLEILSTMAANQLEIAQLVDELQKMFDSVVETLAATIDARDPITAGHSKRVTLYCLQVAEQLNFDQKQKDLLRYSALLHDYGKIGVREAVLTKDGRLEDDEYKHIQTHVVLSKEILRKMYFRKDLRAIPEIAGAHHEKVDGSGYPKQSAGDTIPLMGRIMGIADVFDALTYKRHYRDPMPIERVLKILESEQNKHFDPLVVRSFFSVPVSNIASIIVHDAVGRLPKEDEETFTRYALGDFYSAVTRGKDQQSEGERRLVERFIDLYNSRS